jgi:hypothetical protein
MLRARDKTLFFVAGLCMFRWTILSRAQITPVSDFIAGDDRISKNQIRNLFARSLQPLARNQTREKLNLYLRSERATLRLPVGRNLIISKTRLDEAIGPAASFREGMRATPHAGHMANRKNAIGR